MKLIYFSMLLLVAGCNSASKEEKARDAVRLSIERGMANRAAAYKPISFKTSPYANTENLPDRKGATEVVHTYQVRDSANFVTTGTVRCLVTTAGKVYVTDTK